MSVPFLDAHFVLCKGQSTAWESPPCQHMLTMLDSRIEFTSAHMKYLAVFLSLLICGTPVRADLPPPTSQQGWDAVSKGFRQLAKVAVLNASNDPSEITPYSSDASKAKLSESTIQAIDKAIAMDKTRIFLVTKDRKIIHKNYATWWLKNSTPLGYSMSKSLTSMAIGKLLCKYDNTSIETKGFEIIKEFKDTSWGNSTIKETLMMTSGSSTDTPPHTGWHSEVIGAKHRGIFDGKHNLNFSTEMISDDKRIYTPGTSYQYNNYDTIFLGLIVEALAKKPFYQFFDEEIWQNLKSEKTGAWIISNNEKTLSSAGFSASPEDWLRIGNYVIDSIKKDDCFGKYLKTAVEPLQKTHTGTMCYGYQIWNFCRPGIFHFWGFGGQHLIMMPAQNIVIYTHSAIQASDSGSEMNLFRLFREIIKDIQQSTTN